MLIAAAAVVVVAMIVKAVHRPEAAERLPEACRYPVACAVAQMTTSGDRLILSLSGDGLTAVASLIADMVSGKLIGQFELNGN